MIDHTKRMEAVFYRTGQGREVVLDWLRALGVDDRRKIGFGKSVQT